MRRFARFAVIVALVVFSISLFRSYRVRAVAEEAAQFAPAAATPVLVPAGTAIPAVIWNGISESAAPGDSITAVVSKPVIVNGELAIPSGSRLKGKLQKVSFSHAKAKVQIGFNVLLVRGRNLTIQARPFEGGIPVETDLQILSAALTTLMEASLGAAIGAGSGNPRVTSRGLFEGVRASALHQSAVPITVILTRDLTFTADITHGS